MKLTEPVIRLRLRKLRRQPLPGTSLGLQKHVRALAAELSKYAEQLDTRPKKTDRESDTGRDREEHGGQDRSDS